MLIVGLGNTGKKYMGTRHNVGFKVVRVLHEEYNFSSVQYLRNSAVAEGVIEKEEVVIAQPREYMNNSGKVVKKLVDYYNISSPREIIIIYDDMDLPQGKIRIKKSGGSGGHKGLASVINKLGTKEISRIRIGIGRPPGGVNVSDYVLSKYSGEEQKLIESAVQDAVKAVGVICVDGFTVAMNEFN